ncbi:hypothetical protein, partial [Pseudomonas aeruginosa]
MRGSRVYRWPIPRDAAVVLREGRLKPRDGLFIRLR